MSSEIYFQGKKFISSKRAALLCEYSQDYVGQLIRSKKIKAQMIGRSWYVSERSILNYKNTAEEVAISASRAIGKGNVPVKKSIKTPFVDGVLKQGVARTEKVMVKDVAQRVRRVVKTPSKMPGIIEELLTKAIASTLAVSLVLGGYQLSDTQNLLAAQGVIESVGQRMSLAIDDSVARIADALNVVGGAYLASLDNAGTYAVLGFEGMVNASRELAASYVGAVESVGLASARATDALAQVDLPAVARAIKTDGVANISLAAVSLASDPLRYGFETVAIGVYEAINPFFGKTGSFIAGIFSPKEDVIVATVPPVKPSSTTSPVVSVATSGGASSQTSSVPASQPSTTQVSQYYSTVGLTQAEVSAQIAAAQAVLEEQIGQVQLDALRANANARGSSERRDSSNIDRADIDRSSITASTISGSTIANSNLVGTTTATNLDVQNLTANSITFIDSVTVNSTTTNSVISSATTTNLFTTNLTSQNAPRAPYFIATDASATSTFAGGLTVAGSTGVTVSQTGRLGIGTNTPNASLEIVQATNGTTIVSGRRATDVAPTGDFIEYLSADGNTVLFRVDNSGNLLAGGIINTGSQTVTSTSTPQFRVQYDSLNELTTSVASTGAATLAISGSNPSLSVTPQTNGSSTFSVTNASSTAVLSVDTNTSTVTAANLVASTGVIASATTTNLYSTNFVGVNLFADNASSTNFGASTISAGSISATGTLTVGGSRFFVGTDGNVGVGTTSPSARLSVHATTGGTYLTPVFSVASSTTGSAATSTLFTINGQGNVGIGGYIPSVHNAPVGYRGIWLDSSNSGIVGETSSGFKGVNLNANAVRSGGNWAQQDAARNSFIFSVGYEASNNGLTLARAVAGAGSSFSTLFAVNETRGYFAGNVGIGTTSPSSRLSVEGAGYFSGDLTAVNMTAVGTLTLVDSTINSFNNSLLLKRAGGTANSSITFFDSSNTTSGRIGTAGSNSVAFYSGNGATEYGRFSSTGSFGIGTSSPSQRLSVEGGGHFAGNLTASNITATGTLAVSGGVTLSNASTTNLTVLGSSFFNSTSTFLGNVTLSNNGVPLTLGDGANVANSISISPAAGPAGRAVVGYDGSNAFLQGGVGKGLSLRVNGGSTALHIDSASGNVGIGTTTPTEKLSILSGDNTAATNILSVRANNLTVGTALGYNGVRSVGSNTSVDLSLLSKGTGYIWLGQDTDGAGLRIRYNDGGKNTIYNGANDIGITANSGQKIYLSQASSPSTGLTVDTTTGNVGIGTTTPQNRLSVVGSATNAAVMNIQSTASNGYSGIDILDDTGAAKGAFFWANSGASVLPSSFSIGPRDNSASLNLVTGTSLTPRLTILTGGNVGIGTTTPSTKLNVVATGNETSARFVAANQSMDNVQVQSTASNGYSTIGFLSSTGASVGSFGYGNSASVQPDRVFFNSNSKTMGFSTNNGSSNALTIATGGNIGIGTSTPSSRLDVGGDVANNQITVRRGGASPSNISLQAFTSFPSVSYGGAFDILTFLGNSGSNEYMRLFNGSLLVGTTSASTNKLVVEGSGLFAGNLTAANITATGTLAIAGNTSLVNASTTNLTVSSNAYFPGGVWNSGGSVGIGTTTPGSSLAVAPSSGVATFELTSPTTNSAYLTIGSGITGTTAETRLNFYNPGASTGRKYWRIGSADALAPNGPDQFRIDRLSDTASSILASPFVISSSDNVGIGTTSPIAKLSVVGNGIFTTTLGVQSNTTPGSADTDNLSVGGNIGVQGTGWNSGSGVGSLIYVAGSSGSVPLIQGRVTSYTNGANFNTDTAFYTRLTTSSLERMRITSAGNVGIGTSTPSGKLEVLTSALNSSIVINDAGTNDPALKFYRANGSGSYLPYAIQNTVSSETGLGDLAFRSGSAVVAKGTETLTTRMVLTSGGNLGVGTTTPSAKLHVNQATASSVALQLDGPATGGARLLFSNSEGGNYFISDNDKLYFGKSTTVASVNDLGAWDNSTGNFGIGTTTPLAKLAVSGGNILLDSGRGIEFINSVGTRLAQVAYDGTNHLTLGNSNGGSAGTIINAGGGGQADIVFNVGPQAGRIAAMYINGSGNVGIGTTNPGHNLSVVDVGTSTRVSIGHNGGTSFGAGNVSSTYSQLNVVMGTGQTVPSDPYPFQVLNSSGTRVAGVRTDGMTVSDIFSTTNVTTAAMNQSASYRQGFLLSNTGQLVWSGNSNWWGTPDVGLSRISAGVIGIGNGTQGSATGTLSVGNLGIGTTTPGSILTLAQGTASSTGISFGGDTFLYRNSAGGLALNSNAASGALTGLAFYNNGISGTGNYELKLQGYQGDDAGSIYIRKAGTSQNGFYSFGGTGATDGHSFYTGGSPSSAQTLRFNINNSRAYFSGNVGIGTTSPAARFAVSGDVLASNFVATSTTASSTFMGTVGLGTSTPQGISGNMFGGAQINPLVVAGDDVSRVTSIIVSGNAGSAIQFADQNSLAKADFGVFGNDIYFVNRSSGNTRFNYASNSEAMRITSTGNVGIGTTTPSNKLEVAGSSYFGGDATFISTSGGIKTATFGSFYGLTTEIGIRSSSNFGIDVPATGTFRITKPTAVSLFSVDALTNNSYFATNVGVGTTTPDGKMTVYKTGSGSSSVGLTVHDAVLPTYSANADNLFTVRGTGSSATTWRGRITAGGDNRAFLMGEYNSQAWLGAHTANLAAWADLYINPDGTTQSTYIGDMGGGSSAPVPILTVSNALSNVGIGTSTPAAKLAVVGDVLASYFNATSTTATSTFAGGFDVANGAIRHDWASGATTIQNLELGNMSFESDSGIVTWVDMPVTAASSIGTKQSYTAGINGNPLLTVYAESDGAGGIQNSGVGIGTSTPLAKLDIWGNFRVSTSSAASTPLVFADTGTGMFGLGTSSPTAQLHTTGTVRFSNFGSGSLQTDASGNVSVSSDERLKDIEGSFSRGLADIVKINPILYKWNATSGLDMVELYAGFSAQNIELAIPEAVGVSPSGYLSLNDRPILATAVNAIKELNMSIASTTARIASVEQRITSLEATLASIGSGSQTTIINATTSASSTVEAVSSWLASLGVTIENTVARFATVIADVMTAKKLTVGDSSNLAAAGITIFDRATGAPVCMFVENGVMKSEAGECGVVEVPEQAPVPAPEVVPEETPEPEPAPVPAVEEPTGTTTPEASPEPESVPAPEVVPEETPTEPASESVPEVVSEPTPEPAPEPTSDPVAVE